MSPKETPVAEETIRRWVQLRRAGWSFARIGQAAGIDRRTVARLVRLYEGRDLGEALASARHEVAARLLEQHFRDLEGVAITLLRLVSPPSLRASLYMEPPYGEEWLEEHLAAGVMAAKVYLPGVGPDALDRHLSRRRAQALVAALKEHLPQVWAVLAEWEQCAQGYHQLWLAVEGEAIAAGISGPDARAGLEVALRRLRGKEAGKGVELPGGAGLSETEGQGVERWLGEVQGGLKELVGLLGRLEGIFLCLEDMLEPEPLHRSLLGTRCRLCPV